jgi:hypothetical protein
MKRLLLAILILVALGGGGAAGWWFLLREPPLDDAAAAEEESGGLIAKSRYVELDPIVLPIIREGQIILHVNLVLNVELRRALPVEDISARELPLRDAMIRELHALYGLRYVQDRGFDLPIVRERLARRAEEIFGPETVATVLIHDVNQRKPGTG